MDKNKKAGVRFNPELYINFIYHPDTDTIEIYRNGELITDGGGVTPEELMQILEGYVSKEELNVILDELVTKEELTLELGSYIKNDDYASDDEAGIIKVDSINGIEIDDGVLVVKGRLGQFPNGGLYYPTDAEPTNVGNYSLLISEAKKLSTAHRDFIIAGGSNIKLKTTATSGATEYRVANTQANRFMTSCFRGGRLAKSEADAKNKTVGVVSVKYANGNDCIPYFGADEPDNDIIITVDETLNPDGELSQIRGYGTWLSSDIMSAGQGNRVDGSKTLQVGQACQVDANKTNVLEVGYKLFSSQGSCIIVGTEILNKKMGAALFGRNHNTSNGVNYVCLVGQYSECTNKTLFAVGNGNSNNTSNAFEVQSDGIIIKSPNNTKFKISVDDSGNLITTQV